MHTTFPQLLLNHARQRPDAAALREKEYGIWQTTTWAEMAQLVEHMACGLHQAGLTRGEHMVVVGSNRPRLYAAMLAAQSLGAIPVPLYQDAAAAECVFPLNNAEIRFAVVEDQEQVDKLLEIRAQCPQLGHIFYDDPRGLRNYDEPGLAAIDELIASGQVRAQQHPVVFIRFHGQHRCGNTDPVEGLGDQCGRGRTAFGRVREQEGIRHEAAFHRGLVGQRLQPAQDICEPFRHIVLGLPAAVDADARQQTAAHSAGDALHQAA